MKTERERVNWHLSIPVCQTKRGCLTHLELMSFEDLALLCRVLNANVEEIVDKFFRAVKGQRGKL